MGGGGWKGGEGWGGVGEGWIEDKKVGMRANREDLMAEL